MLLRSALRGVQIALLAVCAYLVYAGVAPIVVATTISSARIPPIEELVPSAHQAADYAIIGGRNLFAPRVPAEAAPPPEPTAEEDEIEETKLSYRLHGTIAPGPDAVAALEDLNTRERHFVRAGDDLPNQVKVRRIERRRVVIENKDQLEAITMDEDTQAAPAQPKAKAPPRNRRRGRRASAARRATERAARQLEEVAGRVTPAPRINSLLEQATFEPLIDDQGQVRGLEIVDLEPGSPLAEAGVTAGSVCDQLNGVRVTGLASIQPALAAIQAGGETCITCTDPSGSAATYCY